ncbi:DNA-dependent protein kinase catalytic subunit-like [Gigantopelta aegis]|uniref:DNA-dependent protein kinase catalytic subunit-like n=1 Tax=Gigantopelta aegis TaxID=1735272 RepID=UPI001B88A21A|nr:DNA-dependent protein kinase catalytic subunit-like [Gigantopelta aegis]
MAAMLEDSLRTLHNLKDESEASSVEQINTVVADITQIILNEISDKDTDYCCSVLFDKKYGVVSFLQSVVTKDEFQNSKAALLDLLSGFLQKANKKIVSYLVDIKEVSVSLFIRDRYAKVKNAAIPVLIKVLELSVGSHMGEELKIDALINKFFMELTKSVSKLQASVKGNIMNLLGVLSEVYPEKMLVYSDRLVSLYASALKAEMSSKTREPQLPIIAGCLEGLTCYLVNFTQSAEEGSKYAYEIFRFARMAIDPGITYTRYAVPAAGLRLFSRHADQFSEYLVDDYQGMYEKLQNWSHHHNRDLMHLGVSALESFLQQVAKMLVSRANEGQKEGAVFKFFVKQFREIMNDHQASVKQISFAIKGYGLLAAPCKTFMTPSDVHYMLSEMINKSEQHFLRQSQDLMDRLYELPSYLNALAHIIKQVDEVSDTYAMSLEHLLVLLFENVPHVHGRMHFTCQKSIIHVLLTLMTKGTTFQQVLSGFVYQSLIRLCSHPVLLDNDQTAEDKSDEAETNTKKTISYKDYLDLWAGILDSAKIKDFAALDISIAERHKLTEALYDELLTAILKIITKLDLTSTSEESNEQVADTDLDGIAEDQGQGLSADPIHGIQPAKPKDFQVLINLVDFCRNLLPYHHYELFNRWMFPFSHTVILLSTKNPFVSGFYKLLAVAMRIANQLEYFKEVVPASPVKGEPMEVDQSPTEGFKQKDICFQLVKTFSKEVLVRMKQYQDDLLASCLTLILVLPKEIVKEQLVDVVPVIQICLTIGLSYLPLAMVGLEALEYWSQHLPDYLISPHYKDILPYLDSYLQTAEQMTEVTDSIIIMKESKSGRGKKKLPTRIVRLNKKDKENKSYESQLAVVKQRIVRYLGSLGGSLNHALLACSDDDDISKKAIAWDTHQHLRFDMPFVDMKPTIYFDPFLPRIVELATKSSDRQTKVAACELLHSLVLYCLGRGAQQPGERIKRHPMDRLYKKLFPVILELACDVEPVARQLFEELSMQLIHWFTSNKMAESSETMALLDTIFDGLVQQTDTSLRDFCARCLREFMMWSIKQTSKKDKSPVNAKSVLKRIFSFALHPSAFKRLGAALAFNNIYMVFREEHSLVDHFTFQILVHFVESLAIAHTDEKSLGTQTQCASVLTHLEKILQKRADMFMKDSNLREEPREWSKKTLDIAVRWLTRQCGRPQTECRHTCMKLVTQLAPLVQGIKSAQNYFQIFLKKEGPSHFLSRFEGGGQAAVGKKGLSSCSTLNKMSDTFSLSDTLHWFDMLLAPLDCYTWVFGQDLLTPTEILSDVGKVKASIFESIQYFLEHLALAGIEKAAMLFTSHRTTYFFTPKEMEEYNRAKCTVVIRMWNFLCVILGKCPKDAFELIPDNLWCSQLWELLCKCVVHPSDVGFNVSDVEIMSNLPGEMERTLMVLTKCLPPTHLKCLKQTLTEYLQGDRNVFAQLPLSLTDPRLDHPTLTQLISGYGQLSKVGLLTDAVKKSGNNEKLARQLFDSIYQGIVLEKKEHKASMALTPTSLTLGKCMLELAFQLNPSADVLISSLLEEKKVCGLGRSEEEGHGSLFFSLFKSVIALQLTKTLDVSIPLLAKRAGSDARHVNTILVAMVDYIVCDRSLRKKYGERMVSVVLMQWRHFRSWCLDSSSADLQELAVLLFTKLLLLDSKFASNTSHPAYQTVFEMYETLLTDSRTNLTFKNRVLDLLPFFALVEKPYISKLKASLDTFISNHFPLKSSELTKDSPKFIDYITAIDKLLSALELSCNPVLLEVVISIFCRESRHAHEDEIQKCLTKFIRKLPGDKQKLALDIPYGIFVKEGSFPAEIRRATLERVCLPMLQLAKKSALIEFFCEHIVEIMQTVEAKQVKSALENQLISKTCCFELLEVLYSRLSKEELNTKNSVINQKYCGAKAETGKELTLKITKSAHEAKSEDIRGETTLLEERRQYHCSAYNLLIAVISCTQTDSKFYNGFLFSDKEAKGQFLLDNIIDKDAHWEFQAELQTVMERKKKFVSIRNELKKQQAEDDDDSDRSYTSSFHLASMYLADSSLSEDVNRYDFSLSVSAQSTAGSSGTDHMRTPVKRKSSNTLPDDDPEGHVSVEGDYVELEMDQINQHECMATMIALLKHMQRNNIPPAPPHGSVPSQMPDWMSYLHKKMTSVTCHGNIKLFIAKLITNTAEIFQPYGKFWLCPLSQLIFSGPLSSGGINYFVVDIIVTMMSWHSSAVPQDTAEECAMASRLVEFVMSNIYHETRQVFRNNLEMLKTLLECWKGRVQIPYRVIYSHLKSADVKSRDSPVGIQLLGIVMACKLPPYGPDAPVDQEKFFSVIANIMYSNYKIAYAAAAEVVGMLLSHLAEKEHVTEGTFHEHINNVMSSIRQAKPDIFIVCVHKMCRHYPAIANRFTNRLLFMLPKVRGEFRTLCLEVIHGNVDKIEDVYLELKTKGLITFITQRDEGTQLAALNIVKSISAKLKPPELLTLMPAVTGIFQQSSAACHKIMYEILMWIYDNYRDEKSDDGHEIISQTKEALLKGLGDEDLHCRLLIQNFWSSETRLPVNTMDRMIAMLEAMYSPSTEQQYLSYATNLLLEMTSKSPDYQREIFEHPLSECKFQEYSVQSSWRQHHVVMTPLFAATQASQSMDVDTVDSTDGRLRATQTVQQFTQTVADGSHAPFNWLTQSSLDTYAETSSLSSAESRSSLLFTVGSQGSQQMSGSKAWSRGAGSRFGQRPARPKAGTSTKKEESSKDDEIWRLKRRFLKDQEVSRMYFVKQNIRLKRLREEKMKEQQMRRESQVTMYRKYRTGELPDIQLKFSYIIAPLQAVAQRDSTVAKMLFSSMFKAIFAGMDGVKTDREIEEATQQINKSIESILTLSKQYFPPFIACIMNVLHDLKSKLKVDASSLASSALTCNLQPLGITVLEEHLIQYDGNLCPPKRSRGEKAPISTDVALWIELARLYKSVDEYDVLHGIFSGKIKTKSITGEALECEARGDFHAARRMYDEALSTSTWADGDPLDAEIDLWDDCRMECLDHLTQWQALEEVTVTGIDSTGQAQLNQIWEDTFALEHYLPGLLRSKLKLLLQGDNSQQSLLSFIDLSMKDTEKKAMLESQFCEQLALMYLWQEDYGRSRHYAALATQRFLQNWISTDSLMMTSRTRQLQTLQPLLELEEFLQFLEDENNFLSTVPVERLVKRWETRSPHMLLDSVNIWDDIVTNRNIYLDRISTRLTQHQKSHDSMDELDEDMFEETKLRQRLAMAESSMEQNNFHLTLRIMKETHSRCKNVGNEKLLIEWSHLYATTHHKKAQNLIGPWTDDTFFNVLTTLEQLDKYSKSDVLSKHNDLGRQHFALKGRAFAILADGFLGSDAVSDISTKTGDKLKTYCGVTKQLPTKKIVEKLVEKGYHEIKGCVADFGGRQPQQPKFGEEEAQLAVALYCDKFLRMKEDEDVDLSLAILKTFPDTIIVCMLRAMKFGSSEARQRFPRLLQLVEYYPETMAAFVKQSSEVSSWMFLLWINQMMALLNKREAPAVQQILHTLVVEYPQAVVYAFHISYEGFVFGKSAQDLDNKAAVNKIKDQLTEDNCPLVSRLISALDQFGQPDMLFKDWSDRMKKLLASAKRDKEEIKKVYREMYSSLIDCDSVPPDSVGSQTSLLSASPGEFSEFRKKFAQIFKKDFDEKFGKNGDKLVLMSYKTFRQVLDEINKKAEDHKKPRGKLYPPASLREYSQWMADFNPNRESRDLEIPGQYHGLTKPMPEYHVKVAGFDERILVMSSLRKPKRLTIRGNDEKDYSYLVKGGEDLRLDQRIEQLFVIMNKIMEKDPACRVRKLQLKTYQVIPMSTRVGLIEWMSNTCPLKDFLYAAFTEAESKFFHSEHGPSKVHQKWTGKFWDPKKQTAYMYAQVYLKYNKTETVREFRIKENKVPWDLSRRAFHDMSTSPEAFHVLRCMFVRSHAVICVCQYLLGIGDRHLSNFMVNLRTGQMVGIDFGHAFGSATQFLPVPELMPFRLTRQIVNIALPLQIKGLFENTMVHVLRALRNNSDLLLNTMDVFVKEPSLDWMQFAEKQKAEGMEPEDADDNVAWYPKEKIQYAHRKLKGANPCCITKDELALGQSKSAAFQCFQEVAVGDKRESVRAQLPPAGLSVEQQVAALIDQATDPNLLGRVWGGWEAWV